MPPTRASGGAGARRAAAFDPAAELTRAQVAAVLGCDERSITNYQAATPPIPTIRHGRQVRYPLAPCVLWYVDFRLREARGNRLPSELDMARSRKAIADARRVELELAQLEGRLLPDTHVEHFCEALADRVVAIATGGLTRYVADVQRAETGVAAQRLLEQIGEDIVASCAQLAEELAAEGDALDEDLPPVPEAAADAA